MRAIIADDEKKICMLLRELVDWQELGIEIVDEAYSGTSAYEKIKRLKPDIVVTDIRMPGMDGLEMIRRLKRDGLDTEFIIISGHKNFEYAHSAIQYGVSNYLLKPLTASDLHDNLVEAGRRLLQRRNSAHEMERLQNKLDYSRELIGRQFVSRFCGDPRIVSEKSVEALNRQYYTNFSEGSFAVALVHLNASRTMSREQSSIMLDKVEMYFSKRLKSGMTRLAAGQHDGNIALILNVTERSDAEVHLRDILDDAQRYFADFCTLELGLSNFAKALSREQLHQAQAALCSRLDMGTSRIIRYADCNASEAGSFPEPAVRKQLFDAVALADRDRLRIWLQNNYERLTSAEIPPITMLKGAHSLVDALSSAFTEFYKRGADDTGAEDIHAAIWDASDRGRIVTVIADWTQRQMEGYISEMQDQGAYLVRVAQKYISEHYAEDISLNDVAAHVHLNPTYFSTLFKKKQNTGFSEYLAAYRIDRAKELLADPTLSIAGVGSRVGYGDAAYFSKLFTKTVGIRPKDFRKLCL